MQTLWTTGNPKTAKGAARGFYTGMLHLAPHNLGDGQRSVCPHATAACIRACLNTAGRGGVFKAGEVTNAIQEARKRRTREFFADREAFAVRLLDDAERIAREAKREGLRVAFRLNGTSDLDWQRIAPTFVANLGDLGILYDYTKDARKAARYDDPIDYGTMPATFLGVPVVNGDEHDLTFLRPGGVVLGLKAKGRARAERSAFVVRL